MPQVFQVLKCYKCTIFQVHQTKKDNKWKCKVCGEKQSVKRHYGIGIAKDCRIHVQKLNNLQGNIEESKLKAIDSENSDCEENHNDDENEINNTEVLTNSAKKESKWLAYIEKEEICIDKEPDNIDDVEVCLELLQKRKICKKIKCFKVPKVSNETNKITEIIDEITALKSNTVNSIEHKANHICHEGSSIVFNSDTCYKNECSNKKEIINKSTNLQVKEASKWARFIELSTTTGDQNRAFGINIEENSENHDDDKKENTTNDYYQRDVEYDEQDVIDYIGNKNKDTGTKTHKNPETITSKPLFSLCDDNDLDNILDL